jgi:hypothetical protein
VQKSHSCLVVVGKTGLAALILKWGRPKSNKASERTSCIHVFLFFRHQQASLHGFKKKQRISCADPKWECTKPNKALAHWRAPVSFCFPFMQASLHHFKTKKPLAIAKGYV